MNANTCPECGADMKHSPCCARAQAKAIHSAQIASDIARIARLQAEC